RSEDFPMNQHSQPANNSPVTLINVFEVPTEHVEVFIAGWRQRAALMSTKPGFVDTRLHRALSPQTRFQLVNVAHWESREAMEAATADPEFQQRISAAIADPPSADRGEPGPISGRCRIPWPGAGRAPPHPACPVIPAASPSRLSGLVPGA